jgi:hypothetical protein
MSYTILRDRWYDIIVLNVHAPREDKIDDMKNQNMYSIISSKYHVKILLGDFNAKVGWEDILKPTIGNERFHEISNDNGVIVLNFVTFKKYDVPTSLTFINLLGYFLTERSATKSIIFS